MKNLFNKITLYITLNYLCDYTFCQFEEYRETNSDTKEYLRIVNGSPAKLGDVPYQVAFKIRTSRSRGKYTTFCGGVIISEKKLLTAAHCFENKGFHWSACCSSRRSGNKKLIKLTLAVAGNLDNDVKLTKDTPGQWRSLKAVYYPTSYKFPKDDIAYAFLKHKFRFNTFVKPIPYASVYKDYASSCLASGYGRTANSFTPDSPKSRSPHLQVAYLDVLTIRSCSRKFRKSMRKFVCTSNQFSDTSQGDSGGPLVCKGTGDPKDLGEGILVGIVSGAHRRKGTFFTRVSSHKKFIESGSNIIRASGWTNYIFYTFVICLGT